jgi:hypothetical protein
MDIFSIPLFPVSIGLFICWAMFAIFCSTIHEAITLLKAERGRFLKKWLLKQLLDHPNGVNWGSMLYAHGSVDLLTRATSTPTSTIDSKLFAETLIEVVGNANIVKMEKSKVILPYKSDLLNDFKAATLILKPSDVVSFYQQAMRAAELCRDMNGNADESAIYNCLVLQVQRWYDDMTERISFWYKKRTRARLFFLGFLLALVFNIDTIELFNFLGKNKSSQKVLMGFYEANADRLNKLAVETNDSIRIDSLRKKVNDFAILIDSVANEASLPIGWDHSLLNLRAWGKFENDSIRTRNKYCDSVNAVQNSACHEHCIAAKKKLAALSGDSLSETEMKVESKCLCCENEIVCKKITQKKNHYSYLNLANFLRLVLVTKLLGFVLSGLAASFGAPFWFDLLKKIYANKPQKV